jgi:hypothetical protein
VVDDLAARPQQGTGAADAEARVLALDRLKPLPPGSVITRMCLVMGAGTGHAQQAAGPALGEATLFSVGRVLPLLLDGIGSLGYFFWGSSLMVSTSPQ